MLKHKAAMLVGMEDEGYGSAQPGFERARSTEYEKDTREDNLLGVKQLANRREKIGRKVKWLVRVRG